MDATRSFSIGALASEKITHYLANNAVIILKVYFISAFVLAQTAGKWEHALLWDKMKKYSMGRLSLSCEKQSCTSSLPQKIQSWEDQGTAPFKQYYPVHQLSSSRKKDCVEGSGGSQ